MVFIGNELLTPTEKAAIVKASELDYYQALKWATETRIRQQFLDLVLSGKSTVSFRGEQPVFREQMTPQQKRAGVSDEKS